jgi:excisionase family DNA binding protein
MEKLGVSLDEAAKLTSVSVFTLKRQIKCGNLKVARIGRRLVIPLLELQRLLKPAANSSETQV